MKHIYPWFYYNINKVYHAHLYTVKIIDGSGINMFKSKMLLDLLC